MKVEYLFKKWQGRRNKSLSSLVEERTMRYLRQRDDSLYELRRQVLEKKQKVKELEEINENLSCEGKKVAGAEHNKQRQIESYKATIANLQAKLSDAEWELKILTETRQTLVTKQVEFQSSLQIKLANLSKLEVVVSNVMVSSEEELRKKALGEVEAARQDSMNKLA